MMLEYFTGTSFGLAPFKADFVDYGECNIPIKDVTKVNKFIGIRMAIHRFQNRILDGVYLPCVSYHITMDDFIYLFLRLITR